MNKKFVIFIGAIVITGYVGHSPEVPFRRSPFEDGRKEPETTF